MNQEILKGKQETVNEIATSIKNSSSIVIAEYRGLTVEELLELRRELRKKDASLTVYKNSLVTRALNENNLKPVEDLKGPNAFIFSKEVTDGPSVLLKFSKKHANLKIKSGFVNGNAATGEEIKTIASLPNKEGLISMFLCCLNEPVAKFARALDAISKVKNA